MSNISGALVKRRKDDIIDTIQRWQRSGYDRRDPKRFAQLNTVYHGLVRAENDIENDNDLRLHGLDALLYDASGAVETKQQRAARLRQEKLARQERLRQEKLARQDAARAAKQAAAEKKYSRLDAERAAKRAHELSIAQLKYNRGQPQTGLDMYGNPINPYAPLYGGGMPYDPYAMPDIGMTPYDDVGMPQTNIYYQNQLPAMVNDDYGDEYSMPPMQLPQTQPESQSDKNIDSIYADIDSGDIYDVLSGSFGELSYQPTSQRPRGIQAVQTGAGNMLLVGVMGLAILYAIGNATKKR